MSAFAKKASVVVLFLIITCKIIYFEKNIQSVENPLSNSKFSILIMFWMYNCSINVKLLNLVDF